MFDESPCALRSSRWLPGFVLLAFSIAGCDPSTATPQTVVNPTPEKSKLSQKKKHLQDLQTKEGPKLGTP